jgi:hypothetical protein
VKCFFISNNSRYPQAWVISLRSSLRRHLVFNQRAIDTLKPHARGFIEYFDAKTPGLALRVQPHRQEDLLPQLQVTEPAPVGAVVARALSQPHREQRVDRGESLDGAEASPIIEPVMARVS